VGVKESGYGRRSDFKRETMFSLIRGANVGGLLAYKKKVPNYRIQQGVRETIFTIGERKGPIAIVTAPMTTDRKL